MSELRKSFSWLFLYILSIFSLEYLKYDGKAVIFLPTYFYFLVVSVIALSLVFPVTSRFSINTQLMIWGSVLSVFQLGKYALGTFDNPQMAIIEYIFLLMGVWIAHQLNTQIAGTQQIMDDLASYVYPHRTTDVQASGKQIDVEITRSRRHHRPLTLLVVRHDNITEDAQKKTYEMLRKDMLKHFLSARVGQIIEERARQTDLIMRDQDGFFIILCAETDRPNSKVLGERIQDSVLEGLGANVAWATASFPDEALTFEDLVAKAKERINDSKQPATEG